LLGTILSEVWIWDSHIISVYQGNRTAVIEWVALCESAAIYSSVEGVSLVYIIVLDEDGTALDAFKAFEKRLFNEDVFHVFENYCCHNVLEWVRDLLCRDRHVTQSYLGHLPAIEEGWPERPWEDKVLKNSYWVNTVVKADELGSVPGWVLKEGSIVGYFNIWVWTCTESTSCESSLVVKKLASWYDSDYRSLNIQRSSFRCKTRGENAVEKI